MFSRGDIVAVHFPFSDGTSTKLRPALVLSNSKIDSTGDVLLVMITTSIRERDITVELTKEKLSEALPKISYVRCHRIFALEQALVLGKISSVTDAGMKEVLQTILSIIN